VKRALKLKDKQFVFLKKRVGPNKNLSGITIGPIILAKETLDFFCHVFFFRVSNSCRQGGKDFF
jgi:hypothetical protein